MKAFQSRMLGVPLLQIAEDISISRDSANWRAYEAVQLLMIGRHSSAVRWQENYPDFFLFDSLPCSFFNILPLSIISTWYLVGCRRRRTMFVTFPESRSGVIAIDWTRNLSRHLASGGGSSLIAWSSTAAK